MFDRLETYISQLQADPVNFLITMAYTWGVILISLILHECAHGYVAYRCGDPTAKLLGRLSLNPAKHLDPVGTLCMFLLGFGWAKPVPVNPRNFRNGRRDDFLVSIAGVTVNLTIFLAAVILSCAVNRVMMGTELIGKLQTLYADQGLGIEPFVSPFYNVGSYIIDGDWEALAEFLPYAYGGDLHSGVFIKEGMEAIQALMANPWLLYVQRAAAAAGPGQSDAGGFQPDAHSAAGRLPRLERHNFERQAAAEPHGLSGHARCAGGAAAVRRAEYRFVHLRYHSLRGRAQLRPDAHRPDVREKYNGPDLPAQGF